MEINMVTLSGTVGDIESSEYLNKTRQQFTLDITHKQDIAPSHVTVIYWKYDSSELKISTGSKILVIGRLDGVIKTFDYQLDTAIVETEDVTVISH